jgi:hypothetical protein
MSSDATWLTNYLAQVQDVDINQSPEEGARILRNLIKTKLLNFTVRREILNCVQNKGRKLC